MYVFDRKSSNQIGQNTGWVIFWATFGHLLTSGHPDSEADAQNSFFSSSR
jgi:hypothetical protein